MTKTRVGVLFGGRSEEHPVSVKSAREIARHLDRDRYEPVWVGIDHQGQWWLHDSPDTDLTTGTGEAVFLTADPAVGGLLSPTGQRIPLDVVFPMLHGRGGEDGSLQGLLELSGIPYVGCGIDASSLAMDKALAYAVARAAGVTTPTHRVVLPAETTDPESLTYPVFVKPARSGSSFGVNRVDAADELSDAVQTARGYDTKVLIEQAVIGREVGCAILGQDDDLLFGALDRVALTGGFFRIHQEASPETGSENSSFIVPADIAPDAAARVRDTAQTVYRALGCRGLARVDLFLLADGSVVLNEVNTMPGMTSYSRFPRMMAAAGWSLSDVIDRLITIAIAQSRR